MQTAIVIPARLASERFPRKMLYPLCGRPLIYWTWRAALETGLPVYVATDSDEIAAALPTGAHVIPTRAAANGTERCAQALYRLAAEYVINWQGDSPTVPARVALALAARRADFCTPVIPGPVLWTGDTFKRQWQHVGMYGYPRASLERYAAAPPSSDELTERLEQLRFAALGVPATVVPVDPFPYAEVNYPGDVSAVEAILCC